MSNDHPTAAAVEQAAANALALRAGTTFAAGTYPDAGIDPEQAILDAITAWEAANPGPTIPSAEQRAAMPFPLHENAPWGPAQDLVPVTPSDTVYIPGGSVGLIATGAGTIVADFVSSSAPRTFTVEAGRVYPYAVTRVRASGTTATGIFALQAR